MLTFSRDAAVAERQMEALLFSLATFGHIDGDFDEAERSFIKDYVGRLVDHRVATGMPEATEVVRKELIARFTTHFLERFESIEEQVRELFTEAVAEDEDPTAFVHAKLKQTCFEIFQSFDTENQNRLLEAVDEFIEADGHLHPAETQFRSELAALLESDLDLELIDDGREHEHPSICPPASLPSAGDHPFFRQFEHHYSSDREQLEKQAAADVSLVEELIEQLRSRAEAGAGRLAGKQTVADFEPGERFLDGRVHVLRPEEGKAYELIVLGDLHGCYSCLKATIRQSRFFEKVEAYKAAPKSTPYPLLILLGDYIDRGIFSLNGVLRGVMRIATTVPEHVYVLRGNHEYYIEHEGQVYGGVRPAEAINTLKPHLSMDVFRTYRDLFETLPNLLLFGQTLFVHGGIPRDLTLKEKWTDLSTLNDEQLLFQMMWSDPSEADVIPAALQEQSARFPFGRLQFLSFMQRIGCHSLVRGHEKIVDGFRRVYDGDTGLLLSLFSAGGATNKDLPPKSSYRSVTPMALKIERDPDGETRITPFKIDWESYNSPELNAFFQQNPEIEHRLD